MRYNHRRNDAFANSDEEPNYLPDAGQMFSPPSIAEKAKPAPVFPTAVTPKPVVEAPRAVAAPVRKPEADPVSAPKPVAKKSADIKPDTKEMKKQAQKAAKD